MHGLEIVLGPLTCGPYCQEGEKDRGPLRELSPQGLKLPAHLLHG